MIEQAIQNRQCKACGAVKELHHFRTHSKGRVYHRHVCHACRWFQWRQHVEQRECREYLARTEGVS